MRSWIAVRFGDAHELERALHHPERRVAEAVHDPVGQGAVVRADAQGAPELPAAPDERREGVMEPLQLAVVFGVGVFAGGEFLLVGVVAGIDAHLLDMLDRLHRRGGQKVDVRHQRHGAEAGGGELLPDQPEALARRARSGRRSARSRSPPRPARCIGGRWPPRPACRWWSSTAAGAGSIRQRRRRRPSRRRWSGGRCGSGTRSKACGLPAAAGVRVRRAGAAGAAGAWVSGRSARASRTIRLTSK